MTYMLPMTDRRPRGNPKLIRLAAVGPGPARRYAARIKAMVIPWRATGATLAECAARLDGLGVRTFRGRQWSTARVCQILRD